MFTNLDRYVRTCFDSDRARKVLEYSMVFLGRAPTDSVGRLGPRAVPTTVPTTGTVVAGAGLRTAQCDFWDSLSGR